MWQQFFIDFFLFLTSRSTQTRESMSCSCTELHERLHFNEKVSCKAKSICGHTKCDRAGLEQAAVGGLTERGRLFFLAHSVSVKF